MFGVKPGTRPPKQPGESSGKFHHAWRVRELHQCRQPGHSLVIQLQIEPGVFVSQRLGLGFAHEVERGSEGWWMKMHSNRFVRVKQVLK